MNQKIRVLVCDPIHKAGIEKLKRAGFEVDLRPDITAEELEAAVPNYNALIVRSRTKVTKEIIQAGKQLKAIGRAGTGIDNIDTEAARKSGVKVLNTPEAPAEAVAELTMGLILCLARSIPLADRSMKERKWIKKKLMGWELKGKVLGTIGLGNVGEKVARLAKAFGMKILITKRTPPAPELLKELEAEFVPQLNLMQPSGPQASGPLYGACTLHWVAASASNRSAAPPRRHPRRRLQASQTSMLSQEPSRRLWRLLKC